MSKTNGIAKEITLEQAQEVIKNQLQINAQALIDDYQASQAEHNNARFVTMIITQNGPIILEVTHVEIDGQLVDIIKR